MSMSALRLPVAVTLSVWAVWALVMSVGDHWGLFLTEWGMSVTMVFGSFIAGATSEGGGAVAFPVMTLVFEIDPAIARDFSLMIQSVGMTAASVLIIAQRIPVEWRSVAWAGTGGALGIVLGLTYVAPHVPPAYTKILFTSLWLSFAVSLYLVNRHRTREVFPSIEGFTRIHGMVLAGGGVVGGVVSSITGSGLDIITFSLLVLAFRISENVGTPTSVILMASNAIVGFGWKHAVLGGMEGEAFKYWYVCIPVVVVGAPLGARFIKKRSRLLVATFLYVSVVLQFVFALVIIPQTIGLVLTSALTFSLGAVGFWKMGRWGGTRIERPTTCTPAPNRPPWYNQNHLSQTLVEFHARSPHDHRP